VWIPPRRVPRIQFQISMVCTLRYRVQFFAFTSFMGVTGEKIGSIQDYRQVSLATLSQPPSL
jgi:hypothetical protein